MPDLETTFDNEIGPLAETLAAKCKKAGLPFVFLVQYSEDGLYEASHIPGPVVDPLRMTSLLLQVYELRAIQERYGGG
jgi:hypothetical protein